ncbi:MAG TPA: polyketide antibiotic transporter [Pseudolysinimonas sp.]|jgi:ABC-2 type transport system permease protein|nr:polyketide antibiotic transporter [Pseudolysinimonas sp.]
MVRILLQQARRDRITLPIWILGTVLLLTTAATAVGSEYGDVTDRAGILAVALATPALLALRGIPNGDSLGSAVHFQSFAFLAVTIGLMNVFLATRHGRGDEERGRRELVLAAPVSRLAPTAATLVLAVVANALFAVLAVGGYASAGLDLGGSALSAAALAVTGLAFLGLTMIAGELTITSRGANGVGVVLVLGAYAFRAAGDALGRADVTALTLDPAWPSALSPIGWGQQTLAFTADRWWPVAALMALALVSVTAALLIHARRELGEGLVPERSGRERARAGFGNPVALAWRLQWPALVAWAGGSALLGLALGSLVSAVADPQIANPQIQAILASLGHTDSREIGRALLIAVFVMIAAVAGAAGVQAMLRMREEETAGHLEAVLAAPLSRARWLGAFLLVAALTAAAVLLATGAAAALSFGVLGDSDNAWLSLGSAVVAIPAAVSFGAIVALVVAVVPQAAIGLGWGIYGLLAGIGMFGGLMGVDERVVQAISPIANVPALPADDWFPTIVVGGVAVAAAVLAVVGFRRRDLTT